MRVFIGVPLDAAARRGLAAAQSELAKKAQGRWDPPENLHITLRFIGETRALGELSNALERACFGFAPFSVNICGLGSFARQGRSLVFAKVQDADRKLGFLHESLESALGDVGFGRESRAFKPHITLGRDVENAAPLAFTQEIPLRVSEAVLFESLRTPYGMKYEALHKVRF